MNGDKQSFEVESISDLTEWQRQYVPPEDTRVTRRVGDNVRLMLLINGERHEPVWVRITEVIRPVYRGVFECADDFYGGIPNGARFEFTADNIIDY